MKLNKIKPILIILTMCLLAQAISVTANNLTDLQNQQRNAGTRMATARDALNQARRQGNVLLAEILELDVEIGDVTEAYEAAYEQLRETIALLAETRARHDEAVVRRELQDAAFRESARFLHERGAAGYLEILLQSRSFNDVISNIEYIKRITSHDTNILDDLIETERFIAEAVGVIRAKEIEQVLLEAELRNTLEELGRLRGVKEAEMARIESDAERHQSMLNELEAESNRLTEAIRQAELALAAQRERDRAAQAERDRIAQEQAASNMSAALHWPIANRTRISSPFGSRINPISGRREHHTGIDVPAPAGTPILAAESGTVILSGYNGGFGNTVIISHGNGMTTLYAHNTRNNVTVGQTVRRGQQIATVGSTGFSTGNHLHFEVRLNGVSVNPMNYFNR
jgi:murein DD-endopeptidase MepM/ murein hydrolase activator NlpD